MGPSADSADASRAPGVLGVLAEPLTAGLVRDLLRTVIDPELGVNIVDLGLVYDISIEPEGQVGIEMTLTTPGCPLGEFLEDQIRGCLMQLPQARDVRVVFVWEPAWEPSMMSDTAKEQLGWL